MNYVLFAVAIILTGGVGALFLVNQENLPTAYGTYAYSKTTKTWIDIGKEQDKVSLELAPTSKFLVHDKLPSMLTQFKLEKKVFIRSIVTQNPGGSNRTEKTYRMWDEMPNRVVEGKFYPVKGKAEMVEWTPIASLEAGVYIAKIGQFHKESFIVGKAEVLSQLEQGPHCYDLVRTMAWGIPMGEPNRYVPCKDSQTKAKSKPSKK